MASQSFGNNVEIEVKGNKAVITIDITKKFGRSASGKTEIVASTQGNIKIPGTEISLGVNAYTK